jgi:aspartate racemase
MEKIIGILGGMGPLATIDLFEKIVRNTNARFDQEHLKIIIYNNPHIPSRVDAIVKGKESPLEELIKSAQLIESAGADFIVMPCHTAHNWLSELQRAVRIPIINMIELVVDHISDREVRFTDKILLLATTATIKSKMYQWSFEKIGVELLIPQECNQNIIASVIDEVKAGKVENNPLLCSLYQIVEEQKQAGVTAIIGGCTELPLLFPFLPDGVEYIDPTLLLAQAAIRIAENR